MINASVTLILFLFFSSSILQQTDSLKYDLEKYILEKSNLTSEDFDEIKTICNNNPQMEECQMLEKADFDIFTEKINTAKSYFLGSLLIAISLLIFGMLLVFLGVNNFLEAGYKISLNLTIQGFFAAFYYKVLPDAVKLLLNSNYLNNLTQETPKEIINDILNIILKWLSLSLTKTFNLAITIGIIFLIITIILYIIKRKALKEQNKKIKQKE